MSSSQSKERTMFSHAKKKKMIRQIRIAKVFFLRVRKMIPQIRSRRGECKFLAKLPAFYRRLQTFNEKSFSPRVFRVKKWKTSRKLEWNSFVYFSVDEQNCSKPAKQQRKGKTERDASLRFAFYRNYFAFYLLKIRLIFKSAISLKFIHFRLCIQNKRVNITCNSWITSYPYPH